MGVAKAARAAEPTGKPPGAAPTGPQEDLIMFEDVLENLRKATESTIQVQQEMYKKWVGLWPGVASQPAWGEPSQRFQKKWAEIVGELVKKQREILETQFSAGLRNIEEAFHLAEARNPEELRAKSIELWQKSFDCLRQAYEAQVRDFQAAVAKWTEVMAKGAA
jgi:hypothetical protein